jgi:para-aminobenzoate synthetase/4-amino-4-deoxychorismate lyase
MKGTAPRGRWTAEDRQCAETLRSSEKNRAENLMIVDLLRNDLSRIAQAHSVKVDALFAIERHPTLWQMTSTIRASARPGTTLDALFAALFPCGSITGAPKTKAMELIARLETEARGVYCGAIGLIQPGGDAVFNVAIRTVTLQDEHATCGVGGGITWGSTAHDEHAEAMLKARFLMPPADAPQTPSGLFETLRLEQGHYTHLDRHLTRLAESANYFAIPCAIDPCRQQLHSLAQQHTQGTWRVRLDLAQDGTTRAHASPLPETPAHPSFVLAQHPVLRNDLSLYHKTTRRTTYEQAMATAQAAHADIFEVLLWNEDGELTEFTRGNLLLEIDGMRYTPPLSCGLLDGVLRRTLLESGQIQERTLTRNDLERAERILFINSLRGEIVLHKIGIA